MNIQKHLTFYTKGYIKQKSSWFKINKVLSKKDFVDSIYSDKYPTIGCFNAYMTKFFVIDIDDHKNENLLVEKYKTLVKELGLPSFLAKTLHGYHAYYLLQDYYACDLLVLSIKQKLSTFKYQYEVKPTPDVGLRLPNVNNIIDTHNLSKIDIDNFGEFLETCIHYHAEEFIYDTENRTITPDKITDISDGETNSALNYLIPKWRSEGLTQIECTNRFINLLDPQYKGPCTNTKHVLRRVNCYFKNNSEMHKHTKNDIETEFKDFIDKVLKSVVTIGLTEYNKNLRLSSVKKDLLTLLYYMEKNLSIYNNKRFLYNHAQNNPFFKREMDRQCFPLPSVLFSKQNLEFFKKIGILSIPYGRHYSVDLKSCIHYFINLSYFERYKLGKNTCLIQSKEQECSNMIEDLVNEIFNEETIKWSNGPPK